MEPVLTADLLSSLSDFPKTEVATASAKEMPLGFTSASSVVWKIAQ